MSAKEKDKTATVTEVTFDYIKSNFYRVIHADGAVGSPTPSGSIQMNLWSQRRPIPKRIVQAVNADGSLGDEIERNQRADVVREVEAGVVLDLATAIALREWLDAQIKNLVHSQAQEKEIEP